MCCSEYVAWTLWLLGYPDQALKRADEAQSLAKQVGNLYTQTRSLYWDSLVRQFTGQWDVLRERIEVAISMAMEHGFALVLGVGRIMRGWALVTEGRAEEGIRQISEGLERYRATGAGFQLPHLLTALIEAYKKTEQPEEGTRRTGRSPGPRREDRGALLRGGAAAAQGGVTARPIPRRSGRGGNLLPQRT